MVNRGGRKSKHVRSVHVQANLNDSGHSIIGLSLSTSGDQAKSDTSIYYDAEVTQEDAHFVDAEETQSETSSSRGTSPHRVGSAESARAIMGNETWYKIVRDITFPVTIVGFSLAYCGYLFDLFRGEHGNSFHELRELSVLVAPLFRLKSNLEIVAVTKLSTHLVLGTLKTTGDRINYCAGDMCLAQVQCITAGFVAGVLAILIVIIEPKVETSQVVHLTGETVFIVLGSAGLTAALTTLIFGILTAIMLFVLFRFRINPDNIGVPLAIVLGEASTMGGLYLTSNYLYKVQHTKKWLGPLVVGLLCFSVPIWALVNYWYESSKKQLYEWVVPLLSSIVFSCGAGFILDLEGRKYPDIILYQELMAGVGGVLVSVHYSRIITSYHRTGKMGVIPMIKNAKGKVFYTPIDVVYRLGIHTRGFWVFVIMIFPAQTLFSLFLHQIATFHSRSCYGSFLWMYVIACGIHLVILLYITHALTNFLWKRKVNPSDYVIPLIHGFGDVLGTALLLGVSYMLVLLETCDMAESARNRDHHHLTD